MKELNPPERILLGPGPSNIHPKVFAAMSIPLVGYMDPYQFQVMDDIVALLKEIFQTQNTLTFPISGTGMAGMEASICNLVERGDEVVICVNGFFGQRLDELVQRCGGKSMVINQRWGETITRESVAKALSNSTAKVVALVQAETSTGVYQPIKDIASIVHDHNALLIVDAVTSLGGCELKIDDWGVDVCYSGAQKCLNAPPGLSPITLNEKAMEQIRNGKTKVQSFYLDLGLLEKYWMAANRVYHHTPPTSLFYGFREALRLVVDEGLEARWKRHKRNSLALIKAVESMGMEMLVTNQDARLPSLNSVKIPSNIQDVEVRKSLLDNYNIEIGGGLGDLTGKIWRIGLMGLNSNERNVILVISALEQFLKRKGFSMKSEAGVETALKYL